LTEDSGAFKTNQVNSQRVPAFVMFPPRPLPSSRTIWESFSSPPAGGFAPIIFNKRREGVTLSSSYPDSLRAGGAGCVVKATHSVITAFPTAQRPSLDLAKRNLASMLPGFRFLFAAIVLSMSVLVFGFGAAALLRTAHEEFASTPSWQPAPETRFAQNRPAASSAPQPGSQPVLAMLRVDDPPKETPQETPKQALKEAPKDSLKADQPASDAAPAAAAIDQAATTAIEQQSAPEKVAALPAADSSPQETTKETAQPKAAMPEAAMPEASVAESPPPATPDAPAAADPATTAQQPTNQAAPAPAAEIAQISSEQVSPEQVSPEQVSPEQVSPDQASSEHPAPEAAPEPASAPIPANPTSISTRIATLGGPPVTIEPSKAKSDSAKSDDSAVKKRQHARREVRRRRIVVRRLVRQTTQLDAFGQPVASTTR
jgi:hypothetical protein